MLIPFDTLYEGFCNRIRSAGNADAILQLIKRESSESARIQALLQQEPDLCALLTRNINDSFEKKNEVLARKLWERGIEGGSLELLTEGLSHCPIPELFEEKVVLTLLTQESLKSTLKSFLEEIMREVPLSDVNLMASILYDRGCLQLNSAQYPPANKDFLRAWLLGFPKNLDITYRVAVCTYESGELDTAKELLQCTAQHLRTLQMPNEGKSAWTMNIVKVLKAIEIQRKQKLSQQTIPDTVEEIYDLYSGESQSATRTSAVLKLKYSPGKGRHMVALQNIPPGSTVIAEVPYTWTLSKPNYHKFCHWCLQRVWTSIPCSTCASAVFCDATCRQQAMCAFHSKECKILKLLDSSQKLGNMALLCFRTILITPLSTVLEFAKIPQEGSEIPQKIIMGRNDDDKLDSACYVSVFAQTPNAEQRQAGDLLKRTYSAIYLTLCLRYVGYFDMSPTPEGAGDSHQETTSMTTQEIGVAALLLRHLQSASCNAYGINYIGKKSAMLEEEKNLRIEEIGGATYPIISTTNHSCNPNVYRVNLPGKTCLVKALREVKAGEEIYDCYGPLYLTESRQERLSKLQSQYLFRCNCAPCVNDWPSYGALRNKTMSYKCSGCLCELKVVEEGKGSQGKVKCPYCDKTTDLKKLVSNIQTHKERFSLAKQSILAEAFQPFDKDLENILCEYIRVCQTAYLDPCMSTVEAQEVLKLFWNLSIRNS